METTRGERREEKRNKQRKMKVNGLSLVHVVNARAKRILEAKEKLEK